MSVKLCKSYYSTPINDYVNEEKCFTIVTFMNSKFWLVVCLPHKIETPNTDLYLSMYANDENIFKIMEAIFSGYFITSHTNCELDFLMPEFFYFI